MHRAVVQRKQKRKMLFLHLGASGTGNDGIGF